MCYLGAGQFKFTIVFSNGDVFLLFYYKNQTAGQKKTCKLSVETQLAIFTLWQEKYSVG